jgi:DNA-binding PadR family transcriptional regulator
MRSPINWAVLGLLIEHPGHAYELFQRFDSAYAGAIELSSNSQMNGALKALRERALIERLPGEAESGDSDPFGRRRYRPTAEGLRTYEERMMAWSPRSAEAPGVFARQLAVLPAATALAVIEHYEQACLSETCACRVPNVKTSAPGDLVAFEERLIAEEKYLALAAKIEWARSTRGLIKTFWRTPATAEPEAVSRRGDPSADGPADAVSPRRSVRRSGGLESIS